MFCYWIQGIRRKGRTACVSNEGFVANYNEITSQCCSITEVKTNEDLLLDKVATEVLQMRRKRSKVTSFLRIEGCVVGEGTNVTIFSPFPVLMVSKFERNFEVEGLMKFKNLC
ncbi:hypothetical protein CEXT_405191 [Caerostris extrusa]|uniref:Uncharacterized protein n=1 Tax=Caerostris extrusa TaxID=172846 RepID=A0AAV4NN27_CAEEX|nr:hypothetical protein CEXT_405191 [Caerostris extrusa]